MRDKQGTKSGYKSIIKRALSRARRSFSTFSNVERTVSKLWYNLCCAQREQEGRSVAVKCNKKRVEKFVRDWERCSCFFSLIVNFRVVIERVRGKWRRLWSRQRHMCTWAKATIFLFSSMIGRCAYWKIVFLSFMDIWKYPFSLNKNSKSI